MFGNDVINRAVLKVIQIISEIKASGLRGRGGAGFPSGMKWVSISLGYVDRHTDRT